MPGSSHVSALRRPYRAAGRHRSADRLSGSGASGLALRFREKAEALRQHAALIQDVLLHGTTLDAEDVAAQDGVLDS